MQIVDDDQGDSGPAGLSNDVERGVSHHQPLWRGTSGESQRDFQDVTRGVVAEVVAQGKQHLVQGRECHLGLNSAPEARSTRIPSELALHDLIEKHGLSDSRLPQQHERRPTVGQPSEEAVEDGQFPRSPEGRRRKGTCMFAQELGHGDPSHTGSWVERWLPSVGGSSRHTTRFAKVSLAAQGHP